MLLLSETLRERLVADIALGRVFKVLDPPNPRHLLHLGKPQDRSGSP
ncbi:MAG: hypothetical protein V7K50_22125 [Nostoc sp.]